MVSLLKYGILLYQNKQKNMPILMLCSFHLYTCFQTGQSGVGARTSYTGNRSVCQWTFLVHNIFQANDASSTDGVALPPKKKKTFSTFM